VHCMNGVDLSSGCAFFLATAHSSSMDLGDGDGSDSSLHGGGVDDMGFRGVSGTSSISSILFFLFFCIRIQETNDAVDKKIVCKRTPHALG